jgi:hypothetical protein
MDPALNYVAVISTMFPDLPIFFVFFRLLIWAWGGVHAPKKWWYRPKSHNSSVAVAADYRSPVIGGAMQVVGSSWLAPQSFSFLREVGECSNM